MGASSVVRLSRVVPASPDDFKESILGELESLSPGLRVVASAVPVPERGMIDLLAADDRGRLSLISFFLEAGHDSVGRSIAQWDWVTANLGALRALAPGSGLDLTIEPRLLLVAARLLDGAKRLAGFITRPEVELFEALFIASDDRRGVLIERVAAAALPPAGATSGIDPLLASIPAGETRSLMRRILEEVRDTRIDGQSLQATRIDGSVDLALSGRVLATLTATRTGAQVRLVDGARCLDVAGDEGCRAAVAFLTEAGRATARSTKRARPGGSATGNPADPEGGRHETPDPLDARSHTAILTVEEVAEFERITGPGERRADRPRERETRPSSEDSPAGGFMRSRFVEN